MQLTICVSNLFMTKRFIRYRYIMVINTIYCMCRYFMFVLGQPRHLPQLVADE